MSEHLFVGGAAGAAVRDALGRALDAVRSLAALEGRDLDVHAAAEAVELAAKVENAVGAVKAIAAARVAESERWRRSGARSPQEWLARESGMGVGQAAAALAAGSALAGAEDVRRAALAGSLSLRQAGAVAQAASAAPHEEERLLAAAELRSVPQLEEECARVLAAARPDDLAARRAAAHRRRDLRTSVSADGLGRLTWEGLPEVIAEVRAALAPYREAAFRRARSEGRVERPGALDADAFVEMVRDAGSGGGPSRRRRGRRGRHWEAVLTVDLHALRRGEAAEGERCEVEGVGPVPVEVARAILQDAFVSAVVFDGVDVLRVRHLGRHLTAEQRTAVFATQPTCAVPGCGRRTMLEVDHVHPRAAGGWTEWRNLAPLCAHHHRQKTYHGARLEGRPGAWTWHPPVDAELGVASPRGP